MCIYIYFLSRTVFICPSLRTLKSHNGGVWVELLRETIEELSKEPLRYGRVIQHHITILEYLQDVYHLFRNCITITALAQESVNALCHN